MIPDLINIGGSWQVLPPGMHDATIEEVEERFATNDSRKLLFDGFKRGIGALARAGCRTVFLDGSFVTEKPFPNDFDACWDPKGVALEELEKIEPVLLDFEDARRKQKQKFGGEFFPSTAGANTNYTFVEFFQGDRDTGRAKGIIRIQIQKRDRKGLLL